MDYLDGIPLRTVDKMVYRNIVSLRTSIDTMADISDSPEDSEIAVQLEMATKPAMYRDDNRIINRPFDEADWYNAIEFPFANWQQSRFSDGRFGVWYGSMTLEGTIHETAHHWRSSILGDAGWDKLSNVYLERSVFKVHCHASLLDFREAKALQGDLRSKTSYRATQDIGRLMNVEGHPGLLVRSARCDDTNLAIFNSAVLSDPQNVCYLSYEHTKDAVIVCRTPDDVLLEIPHKAA